MSNRPFSYGLASKTGSERDVNEDSAVAIIWPDVPRFDGLDVGLFIVADGMGAAGLGKSASQLAVQVVTEEIKTSIFEPSDLSISEIMTAAVQKAHQQITAEVPEGSTTLTAALIIDNRLTIAHVGDSRAYYAYGKYLIQLTDDHRFLQRLIDQGHYTWEQVARGEVYIDNVLYRTLGQSEPLEVDILTEQLAEGSYLLVATDGLARSQGNYISDMQLLSVIQNNPPQLACDTLIDLAQKGGSTDDISVILIKMNGQ